ncbi:MAG: hypothetical protein JXR95_08735 [Deltaproteobacteria bacterium]|nr:hypothetical protein [Deltaproteobacteria bacterium]
MKNLFAVLFVFSLLFAGCDPEIGDSCSQNIDCSTTGDLICDTASPNGYCTIANCTESSCPEGSRCIAFYPVQSLIYECNPQTEDSISSLTPTDDCLAGEVCLSSGYCASTDYETRFCMKKCSSQDDCRGGYECRETNTYGSQKVPGENENYATVSTVKFCGPGELP